MYEEEFKTDMLSLQVRDYVIVTVSFFQHLLNEPLLEYHAVVEASIVLYNFKVFFKIFYYIPLYI